VRRRDAEWTPARPRPSTSSAVRDGRTRGRGLRRRRKAGVRWSPATTGFPASARRSGWAVLAAAATAWTPTWPVGMAGSRGPRPVGLGIGCASGPAAPPDRRGRLRRWRARPRWPIAGSPVDCSNVRGSGVTTTPCSPKKTQLPRWSRGFLRDFGESSADRPQQIVRRPF